MQKNFRNNQKKRENLLKYLQKINQILEKHEKLEKHLQCYAKKRENF
jgi:hypothetical protein